MSDDELLEIIDKASKSVVHINTVTVMSDYYHRRIPMRGAGSGLIVKSNGLIVTNDHVVKKADRIGVVLYNGELLEGRPVGTCRSLDVAVVKVDGDGLPVAELGDSDMLRVGQRVFAIGNPFGLEGGPSITTGVISAVNRTIKDRRTTMQNLVQTDAAINPGNSGGPLVDMKGKVIAMNTAIIPYAQGIGFAIPINTVRNCFEQIEQHGRFTTPWIGIQGVSNTPQLANYYNLSHGQGVLVTSVVPGSPADKSNIHPGDIIVAFDGNAVNEIDDLKNQLIRRGIGDTVEVQVIRKNRRGYVGVTIEGAP